MTTDEMREYAEMHLYDGDRDGPYFGYNELIAAADEIDRLRAELAEQGQIVHDRTIDVSLTANDRNDWKRRHGELEADREKFRQAVYDEAARQLANQRETFDLRLERRREAHEAEIARLTKRNTYLERRLFPGQGESYANEVERQRNVIDGLQHVAQSVIAERDGLAATIKRVTDQIEQIEIRAKALREINLGLSTYGTGRLEAFEEALGILARAALSTPEENG